MSKFKCSICRLLVALLVIPGTPLARASAYDAHPKLVIILVVDQFRADYLDRYRADLKGRGFRPGPFALLTLVAEEQDASGLVFPHFADRPVEELIVVEIYLEECRTLGNAAGDQCLR